MKEISQKDNSLLPTNKKPKILWILITQAITMFLVVMGHSNLGVNDNVYFNSVYGYFKPFRMPMFVFISGYLFYLTRIEKEKQYSFVVKDKLIRLGIPFLFFTILGYLFKILASNFIKHPINNISIKEVFYSIIGINANPYDALWFVQVIFLFMLLYPIYCYVFKNIWLTSILGIIILYVYFHPIHINYFLLQRSSTRWIFFYVGMLFCKYRLDKNIPPNYLYLLIWIIIYSTLYLINVSFTEIPQILLSFIGITMILHFSKIAEKHFHRIFSSYRHNTYQIYLISVFPQMGLEIIFRQLGEHYYLFFFILNIIIGLYIPILVVKIVEYINWRPLKVAIGLSK